MVSVVSRVCPWLPRREVREVDEVFRLVEVDGVVREVGVV